MDDAVTDSSSSAIRRRAVDEPLVLPRPAISFVVPAFNEEANITTAIERAVTVGRRYCSTFEVIVVDDGSSDRTAELVTDAAGQHPGIRLLRHPDNRGYGEALRTGFVASRLDYVLFTDADNQFDLDELSLFLPWVNHVDVVAGYRKNRQDPMMRRVNGWLWNRLVRVCFYVPVRDIDCAFKLFRRTVLEDIEIESVGAMVNTEVMVKLSRTGKTVVEVGVTHYPRTAGKAQGAKLSVIVRAFVELGRMHGRLNSLGPGPAPVPPPSTDSR
jgi:glycosyltransferase involved in cell wall biosynthesis